MQEHIGKTCPFCRTEFTENETVTECPKCFTAHHEECWKQNNGCSTFGCSEQHISSVDEVTQNANVCTNCKAVLNGEQLFCSECGTKKEELALSKKLCSKCGNELAENSVFCPICGQKADLGIGKNIISAISQYNENLTSLKKKKLKWLYFFIPILLIIGIGGFITIKHNEEVAIEKYKHDAEYFRSTIMLAGENLEGIGNTVQTNWYTFIFNNKGYYYPKFYSIEDAISSAFKDKSSEISTANLQKITLDELYIKLNLPPTNTPDLNDINEAVRDLYNTYTDYHEIVTNPEGNYPSFKLSFGAKNTEFESKYKALEIILKKRGQ